MTDLVVVPADPSNHFGGGVKVSSKYGEFGTVAVTPGDTAESFSARLTARVLLADTVPEPEPVFPNIDLEAAVAEAGNPVKAAKAVKP